MVKPLGEFRAEALAGARYFLYRWTPAPNATAHRICYRLEGYNGQGTVPQLLPGSLGEVSLPRLEPAGRWHFIVIAGQQGSDGAMTWSEWSNWATITVS